jgi:hypothetical protein
LNSLPQNSVNHRLTTALFSSIDMDRSLSCRGCQPRRFGGRTLQTAAGAVT